VLVESEKRFLQPIRIMLYGMEGIYILQSAADLLPVNFDSSYL
jgi:cytidine deaminase